MDFDEFNQEYMTARARLWNGELTDVARVQEELRDLVPSLPTENDRRIAENVIAGLPALLVRKPASSPEMAEALQLLDTANFETGTTDERVAELVRVRKQIWAIADRAGADSLAIRVLTRGLERSEEDLVEGLPWDEQSGDRPRTEV